MSDPYFENVAILLPMNGTDGEKTFTDYSPSPMTITAYGDAHTEADQYKYYDSSGAFDGNGDYLTGTQLRFGTGDFTIEAWVRLTSTTGCVIFSSSLNYQSTTGYTLQVDSGKLQMFRIGVAITGTTTLSTNTWYHVVGQRRSGNLELYVNGVSDATPVGDALYNENSSTGVLVGRRVYGGSPSYYLNGYLQDLRVTKGVARYTSSFTPPAQLTTAYTIFGTVTDADGNPAARTVVMFKRSAPASTIKTTTSASGDGSYSFTIYNDNAERSVIVLADEATLYNDIINRVIPG